MSTELARTLITYFSVSLVVLHLFNKGVISLYTPNKKRMKYKDVLEVLFAIYWPAMIMLLWNTFKHRDKED